MLYISKSTGRAVELRINTPDEGHWADYFMEDVDDQARPSASRRLGDAEAGIIPSPYGEILNTLNLENKKIVDMGCGIGTYVLALNRKGFNVDGVEYSSRLAEKIVSDYPNLTIYCEDATHTHYGDSSIDVVLSLGVVEHDEAGPHAFLKEIFRVLKPGGTLLISVPYYNLFWKLRLLISNPYNPYAVDRSLCHFYQYRFTGREFRRLLENEGFDIVSCGNSGAIKPLEDAFPFVKTVFSIKGGYRFRQLVVKPLVEKMPLTGHMLWMVARKK